MKDATAYLTHIKALLNQLTYSVLTRSNKSFLTNKGVKNEME